MPISPPSPRGATSSTVCTGVTVSSPESVVFGPTFRIRLLSRSVTSAVPSGRNATPHGTASPLTITCAATLASGVLLGVTVGVGNRGGLPVCSSLGGPNAQPLVIRAVASTTPTHRGDFTRPRLTPARSPPGDRRRHTDAFL